MCNKRDLTLCCNVYLNGNRVSDVFQLEGPDSAASCYAATCTASWTYDARERVTQNKRDLTLCCTA